MESQAPQAKACFSGRVSRSSPRQGATASRFGLGAGLRPCMLRPVETGSLTKILRPKPRPEPGAPRQGPSRQASQTGEQGPLGKGLPGSAQLPGKGGPSRGLPHRGLPHRGLSGLPGALQVEASQTGLLGGGTAASQAGALARQWPPRQGASQARGLPHRGP